MTIKVGDRLPEATFRRMTPDGLKEITTSELCAGKRVVLFAVPGAFTPGCSKVHLPGFVERADELKDKGVERVVCIAVNDPWVMDAWGKAHGVDDRILLLADGNAEFTRAMGLEMDASGFGLGVRSRRYAATVENGVITSLAVEPGPGISVSSCEAVLSSL